MPTLSTKACEGVCRPRHRKPDNSGDLTGPRDRLALTDLTWEGALVNLGLGVKDEDCEPPYLISPQKNETQKVKTALALAICLPGCDTALPSCWEAFPILTLGSS